MRERRLKEAIAEYEEAVRTLTATLHNRLVEARLLRRTLETVVEVRHAIAARLEHPLPTHSKLGLRHVHRVF